MAIYRKILQDKFGNYILPVTHERNVRDTEGVSLDVKLAALQNKTATVAWDGQSTPVISRIPSGVTVVYQGQNYTGTLAPSSGTEGKTYLVADGNGQYDRYVTSMSLSDNYVWIPLGNTAIQFDVVDNLEDGGHNSALSAEQGKVLKEMIQNQFVFLTQEEWEALTVIEPDKFYCTYEVEEEEE